MRIKDRLGIIALCLSMSLSGNAQDFTVDLDNLTGCDAKFLEDLATSKEDRMLIIYRAQDDEKLGDVGVYSNFTYRGKEEEIAFDNPIDGAKKIYKLNRNILKNDTKLNVIFTNYNELLYSINKDITSFDLEFAKRNLLDEINDGTNQQQLMEAQNATNKGIDSSEQDKPTDYEDLISLYVAISGDLLELKTKRNVDRCMLVDYIRRIGLEMTDAGSGSIPNELSNFLSHVNSISGALDLDDNAGAESDKEKAVKEALEDLKKVYTSLYNLSKAPEPDFGERVADADVEEITVNVTNLETNQVDVNRTDQFNVLNGWRFSTSIPLIFHGLTNREYVVEDVTDGSGTITGKTIIRDEDNEAFVSTSVGAQFNLYPNTYNHIAVPVISGGIAADAGQDDTGARYFGGLGLIFKNKRFRLGVHGGYIYGTVQRLARGYEVGETYDLSTNEVPTRSVYKGSGYFSISLWLPEQKSNNSGS